MTPVTLTPILETEKLRIAADLPGDARRLLPDIHDRLQAAANSLPQGMALLVIEAFRTQSRQFALWNARLAQIAQQHTLHSLHAAIAAGQDPQAAIAAALATHPDVAALRQQTYITVADPVDAPSGHQCGTSIDVTLLHNDTPLDMGTGWADFATITPTSNPIRTHSPDITAQQAADRAHLRTTMEAQGLVNYPEEWWHFSFGDALWQEVLTHRGATPGAVLYGPIFDNPAFDHHHTD